MNNSSIVPLYQAEPYQPQEVKVSDRPLTSSKQIAKKSFQEFCKCVALQRKIPSFRFSENIHLKEELLKKIEAQFQLPAQGIRMNPQVMDSLVICESGGLNIGQMLHTTSSFGRGQPMIIYSGQVCYRKTPVSLSSDDYEYRVMHTDLFPKEGEVFISAKKIGGFAGFMQDLVDPINGFTRDGNVALVNLIGLPCILHGIGTVLFIASEEIRPFDQLSFSYGAEYWKSFTDQKVQKIYMDRRGNKLKGMLLEERMEKVKLLKSILHNECEDAARKDNARKRAAVLLAVVPREIIDAFSDEEQIKLHQLALSLDDIPNATDDTPLFPDYSGYDAHYLNRQLIEEGKKSPLSALSYLRQFKPSSRRPSKEAELSKKSKMISQKAHRLYTEGHYQQAAAAWAQTANIHMELYSHHGMIFYCQSPIPLHGECVKLYWNIGNAYLKSNQFLDAFENLRKAHQLQQYLDEIALTNKTLQDMSDRLQEAFNQLTRSYTQAHGSKVVTKTKE